MALSLIRRGRSESGGDAKRNAGQVIHCAYSKLVRIEDLKPHPRNPNKHPKQQIELLAKIMREQGIRRSIVVSKRSGFMTIGHGRLAAAILNGWKEYPVDFQDYNSEAMEYADMVADNKIAELADLDMDMVFEDVGGFEDDFDTDLLGIPDFMLPEDTESIDSTEDVPPAPEIPKTKKGDLYQLGRHRLLCGDATNLGHYNRLLGSENIDMIFTDPPYNVDYTGKTKDALKIKNDKMNDERFKEFLKSSFSNMISVSVPAASIYVCHADTEGHNFRAIMLETGWMLKQCCIWVKDSMVLGRQDYHWQHEPILYGWRPGASHNWYSDRKQTTVWEFERPKSSKEHPTMKPVSLIEYALKNSSKKSDRVLDPFGGSGSTLIACERMQRRCFTMELDPKYCDVIVQRWEQLTEKKAKLI